jgi:hypothetical protein
LSKRGELYTLTAAEGVATGTRFTLSIDQQDFVITKNARGLALHELKPAEGYGVAINNTVNGLGEVSATLWIKKDPPGTMTTAQGLALAKEALIAHVKSDVLSRPAWGETFPTNWDEAVAHGVLTGIENFGDPSDRRTELSRQPDRYIFSSPGPFGIHSEIEIRKSDAKILRALVEIG